MREKIYSNIIFIINIIICTINLKYFPKWMYILMDAYRLCAIYLLSIRLLLKILLTRICTSFTASTTSRFSTFKYVFPSCDFVETVPLTSTLASPKRAWNVPFPLAGNIINTPEL